MALGWIGSEKTKQRVAQVLIKGAREHNLKNVEVTFPRFSLVVLTGVSGSGKSSLAFDTLYAEGHYQYTRSVVGRSALTLLGAKRPNIDYITGLSPVIAVGQKRSHQNPRSTVGTLTNIYDCLRLLYARIGTAYSYLSGKKMMRQSEDNILQDMKTRFAKQTITLFAPVVWQRKGNYRALLEKYFAMGFVRARIDGEVRSLIEGLRLERFKFHNIEIWIDQVEVVPSEYDRLLESATLALKEGSGVMLVRDEKDEFHAFSKRFKDPDSHLAYPDPEPTHFSFNTKDGACPECKGWGIVKQVEKELLVPDDSKSIAEGGILPLGSYKKTLLFHVVEAQLRKEGFALSDSISKIPENTLLRLLTGSPTLDAKERMSMGKEGYMGLSQADILQEYGVLGLVEHAERGHKNGAGRYKKWSDKVLIEQTCPSCQGHRLNKMALSFRLGEVHIGEVASWSMEKVQMWAKKVLSSLKGDSLRIGQYLLESVQTQVRTVENLGLSYLSLNRPLHSVSGGEAQRLRLSSQINSPLVGTIYVFDEPSIGLHPKDNDHLIASLKKLRDRRNTVVVVEHDKETILSADHVIDVGPGAGTKGGQVLFSGPPQDLIRSENHKNNATAQYLGTLGHEDVPKKRRRGLKKSLWLRKAKGHNLKGVDFRVPLGTLVCVTGVSGSGKSSLVRGTLLPALRQKLLCSLDRALPYQRLEGAEKIGKVIEVNQSPIGRNIRSNPATYTGIWDEVRVLYAQLHEAAVRGFSGSHFSFNVKNKGRCETCGGLGEKIVANMFVDDSYVKCEACQGLRFSKETLKVLYKGLSVGQLLQLTMDEAAQVFAEKSQLLHKVEVVRQVGLGYITLGQRANTLSGGEAQRMKLASELLKRDTGNTLYILDEPTTGLHHQDTQKLMKILNELVDKGNTVIMIEHNLDILKHADHIVDLGPEGGEKGGQLVASGTPEEVSRVKESYTGSYLKSVLNGKTRDSTSSSKQVEREIPLV